MGDVVLLALTAAFFAATILGALVALGLAVYLVWALFRPEDFS
jgi:K+-transporting ATPase KdpF subunit